MATWTTTEELTPKQSERADGTYRESRSFIAIASDDTQTPFDARAATGIPAYNAVHPNNSALRARRINAAYRGTARNIFTVTVDYQEVVNEQSDDPTDDVITVEYERLVEVRPYNRAVFLGYAYEQLKTDGTTILTTTATGSTPFSPPADNTGKPIRPVVNSAGDYFDPMPEHEIVRLALIVTKNYLESTVNMTIVNSWQNAVNTVAFYGAEIGTLKLEIEMGAKDSRNEIAYRPIKFRFVHKVEGWDDYILDAGFNRIYKPDPSDQSTWVRRPIIDEAGNPKASPELLKGDGQVLYPISSATSHNELLAAYAVFRPYTNRRNFAGLGLGI